MNKKQSLFSRNMNPKYIMVYATVVIFLIIYAYGAIRYGRNAPKRGETESWPSAHHDFQTMENVVMSPHRAGFIEGSLPHLDGAIENIAALIRGEALHNVVDRSKAY